MDHIGGTDTYFRANFARQNKPNTIWGPAETAQIVAAPVPRLHVEPAWADGRQLAGQRRRRGPGEPPSLRAGRGFRRGASGGVERLRKAPMAGATATVEAMPMDHQTPEPRLSGPRESAQQHRHRQARAARPARLGPWLGKLKNLADEDDVEIGGAAYKAGFLREQLTVTRPGGSIAYLTDFLLDDAAMRKARALGSTAARPWCAKATTATPTSSWRGATST